MERQLVKTRDAIAPVDFNKQHFSEHSDILLMLSATNENWKSIRDKLSELVQEAQLVIKDWSGKKNTADWMQMLEADMEQYESLSTKLKQQGIDPGKYPHLLMLQKNIQKELSLIGEYRSLQQKLGIENKRCLSRLKKTGKCCQKRGKNF